MNKLTKFFDRLSTIMLYISMAVFGIVIVLVLVNIIGRSFFNFTIGGIVEIVRYGVLVVMSFSLARTGFNGGHVIVAIILEKLPNKARGLVALLELLLAAAVFFMSAYVCCVLIPDAVNSKLVTEVYKVPYYLVYAILGFGMAVSGIIFVYKGVEELQKGFGGGFGKAE